ncbi:MAG: hypothetical protein JWQ34_2646 [Mucilaginibacter sp.]|nr:hypothetical protein [Mucilaginibacter sp.]
MNGISNFRHFILVDLVYKCMVVKAQICYDQGDFEGQKVETPMKICFHGCFF